MNSDVAAVIVTYNSERVVEALLESLPGAFGQLTRSIVIVDNGSSDGTVALLEPRSDCLLVRSDNVGYAAGVNKGVAAAGDARAILVLNPDTTLGVGSVPAMLGALDRPGVGIVAPQISDEDGRIFRSLRREPTLLRASGLGFTGLPAFSEYVTDAGDYARAHVVDWALGAVLLISRPCFDTLGGFDETYFLYSEETDFCLRARDRGWLTYYTPAAHAMHIGGGSGQSDKTHVMQIVNRVRLYRRRRGTARAVVYFAFTLLSEASWVARGNRPSRAAVRALVSPRQRPPELGCGATLLPN